MAAIKTKCLNLLKWRTVKAYGKVLVKLHFLNLRIISSRKQVSS